MYNIYIYIYYKYDMGVVFKTWLYVNFVKKKTGSTSNNFEVFTFILIHWICSIIHLKLVEKLISFLYNSFS